MDNEYQSKFLQLTRFKFVNVSGDSIDLCRVFQSERLDTSFNAVRDLSIERRVWVFKQYTYDKNNGSSPNFMELKLAETRRFLFRLEPSTKSEIGIAAVGSIAILSYPWRKRYRHKQLTNYHACSVTNTKSHLSIFRRGWPRSSMKINSVKLDSITMHSGNQNPIWSFHSS